MIDTKHLEGPRRGREARREIEDALRRQVASGLEAERVLAVLGPLFDQMEADVFARFADGDYRKVDSPELVVLHLELKGLRRLRSLLLDSIRCGQAAAEEIKVE